MGSFSGNSSVIATVFLHGCCSQCIALTAFSITPQSLWLCQGHCFPAGDSDGAPEFPVGAGGRRRLSHPQITSGQRVLQVQRKHWHLPKTRTHHVCDFNNRPGRFVKAQMAGPCVRSSYSLDGVWSLRICISCKLPGDAEVPASWGTKCR